MSEHEKAAPKIWTCKCGTRYRADRVRAIANHIKRAHAGPGPSLSSPAAVELYGGGRGRSGPPYDPAASYRFREFPPSSLRAD